MKYGLSSSNYKVYHETYLNPVHPWYNYNYYTGLNIFDYAMIVDRTTGQTIKENKKLTPGNTLGDSKYI